MYPEPRGLMLERRGRVRFSEFWIPDICALYYLRDRLNEMHSLQYFTSSKYDCHDLILRNDRKTPHLRYIY